jgi:hypothetical protein
METNIDSLPSLITMSSQVGHALSSPKLGHDPAMGMRQ